MNKALLLALSALLLAGCRATRGELSSDLERNFRDSEHKVKESSTLSSLAQLEAALASYIKYEGSIPLTLDALVPKYISEIPAADTDLPMHRDGNEVKYYPGDVLRGGQIDGSRIADTGQWGYVHDAQQVVVFVDCTHNSSRSRPWYKEHGAH